MAKVAELLVEVGAKTDKLNKGLKDAQNKVEKFGDSVKKIGAIIGVAFGVREVINFGKEIMHLAGITEGVRKGFEHIGGAEIMDDLKKATMGTVDELQLMQKAVQASNFEIPLKSLASLFEFATRRAAQTGESVDYLVNSIVLGIGRKSPLILDNLGISAVRLRQELKGAGVELNTVPVIAEAVGRIATQEMERMGDAVFTSAQKVEQLKARMTDLKIEIGGLINKSDAFNETLNSLNIIIGWTSDSINNMNEQSSKMDKFLNKINSVLKYSVYIASPFLGFLKETNVTIDFLNKKLGDTAKTFENTARQQEPLIRNFKAIKAPLIASKIIIGEFDESIDDFRLSHEELLYSLTHEPGWGSITNKLTYGLQKVKTESELLRESLQYTFEDALAGSLMVADQGIEAFFKSILGYLKNFLARQAAIKIASTLINAIFPGGGTAISWAGFPGGGLPGLQHGGIVTQPTVAAIGERGPEAVIPLSGKNLNIKVTGEIRNKYIYLANKSYEYELNRTT